MTHEHLNEEKLILHYYGEDDEASAVERLLEECGVCRESYGAIQRALNVVDSLPIPERDAEYGARVWQRIEQRLPKRRGKWFGWTMGRPGALPHWAPWRWAAASMALVALLTVAFLAGRFSPRPLTPGQAPARVAAADPQASERILLVAVGDYLERSQMVLIELANADPRGPLNITAAQERAGDLVSETRLYRQTAAHTGNEAVAGVLDELERVLVEITHEPSRISPAALERLRERLKDEGILFKIRVLNANVRSAEEAATEDAPSTTHRKL